MEWGGRRGAPGPGLSPIPQMAPDLYPVPLVTQDRGLRKGLGVIMRTWALWSWKDRN